GMAADTYLLTAAGFGLIPGSAPARDPAGGGILLAEFVKQDFCIRPARPADIAQLMEIESRSWETALRTPQPVIERRIAEYPQGQLVVELDRRVVGVVYTQRIRDSAAIYQLQVHRAAELHTAAGGIVMLLGL